MTVRVFDHEDLEALKRVLDSGELCAISGQVGREFDGAVEQIERALAGSFLHVRVRDHSAAELGEGGDVGEDTVAGKLGLGGRGRGGGRGGGPGAGGGGAMSALARPQAVQWMSPVKTIFVVRPDSRASISSIAEPRMCPASRNVIVSSGETRSGLS